MNSDDMLELEKLFDKKLSPILKQVSSHDNDIRAFKAVLGAFIWLGGAVLAIVAVMQGWFVHK